MPEKTNVYQKYLVYLKDVVYIIGLVIALYGWISAKSKNSAIMETTIKYNTEAVNKLQNFVEKQTDINNRQAELNGKVIQFMQQNSRWNQPNI